MTLSGNCYRDLIVHYNREVFICTNLEGSKNAFVHIILSLDFQGVGKALIS